VVENGDEGKKMSVLEKGQKQFGHYQLLTKGGGEVNEIAVGI
jgi:hypothetical protein